MNIFEQASRKKIRFASDRGELTTEQLWDLPLLSKNGFDLDTVAKAVNSQLKAVSEESFVTTTVKPQQSELELKLEILKHVIAVKVEEREKAKKAADRKVERERLLALLDQKQQAALAELSPEEIQKRLAELDE